LYSPPILIENLIAIDNLRASYFSCKLFFDSTYTTCILLICFIFSILIFIHTMLKITTKKLLQAKIIYCYCLKITSRENTLFTQNNKTVNGNWTSIKLSAICMLRIGFEKMRFLKKELENTIHLHLRNKRDLVLTFDAQYGANMQPIKPFTMAMNNKGARGSSKTICHLLKHKLKGKTTSNVPNCTRMGQKTLR